MQREVTPITQKNLVSKNRSGLLTWTEQPVWESFLAAIQKEKISVFFALKSGRLLGLTDTSLLIGVEKDPYFKELTRKENMTLLEATAKRLFGRPVTVEVKKGGTVVSPAATDQPRGSTIRTTTTTLTITHTTRGPLTATAVAHGRRPLSENRS